MAKLTNWRRFSRIYKGKSWLTGEQCESSTRAAAWVPVVRTRILDVLVSVTVSNNDGKLDGRPEAREASLAANYRKVRTIMEIRLKPSICDALWWLFGILIGKSQLTWSYNHLGPRRSPKYHRILNYRSKLRDATAVFAILVHDIIIA